MDFKDFFPSLKASDFRVFLKKNNANLNNEEIEVLCQILFWTPKGTTDLLCLSIGAPTSPMLSNVLMIDFDQRISKFCAARQVAYTRYADDLSFSSAQSEKLRAVERAVLSWCSRSKTPALTVNESKTVRVSKRDARRVTGLVLTNDRKISLGRDKKRRIRAGMHHFVTGRLDTKQILELRGMLAYVKSVDIHATAPKKVRRGGNQGVSQGGTHSGLLTKTRYSKAATDASRLIVGQSVPAICRLVGFGVRCANQPKLVRRELSDGYGSRFFWPGR
jgi:hypothetical protein